MVPAPATGKEHPVLWLPLLASVKSVSCWSSQSCTASLPRSYVLAWAPARVALPSYIVGPPELIWSPWGELVLRPESHTSLFSRSVSRPPAPGDLPATVSWIQSVGCPAGRWGQEEWGSQLMSSILTQSLGFSGSTCRTSTAPAAPASLPALPRGHGDFGCY